MSARRPAREGVYEAVWSAFGYSSATLEELKSAKDEIVKCPVLRAHAARAIVSAATRRDFGNDALKAILESCLPGDGCLAPIAKALSIKWCLSHTVGRRNSKFDWRCRFNLWVSLVQSMTDAAHQLNESSCAVDAFNRAFADAPDDLDNAWLAAAHKVVSQLTERLQINKENGEETGAPSTALWCCRFLLSKLERAEPPQKRALATSSLFESARKRLCAKSYAQASVPLKDSFCSAYEELNLVLDMQTMPADTFLSFLRKRSGSSGGGIPFPWSDTFNRLLGMKDVRRAAIAINRISMWQIEGSEWKRARDDLEAFPAKWNGRVSIEAALHAPSSFPDLVAIVVAILKKMLASSDSQAALEDAVQLLRLFPDWFPLDIVRCAMRRSLDCIKVSARPELKRVATTMHVGLLKILAGTSELSAASSLLLPL